VVIETPRANRQDKPVYINGNLFGGTYRRNGEGDYRCTESEVKNMLRDSGDITQDRVALDSFSMGALNTQTVTRYRMRFSNLKPNHVWADIFPEDFLLKIGAAKRSGNDGELHPTAAGLLMFGDDTEIVNEFPNYFLDYREAFGEDGKRWSDRVTSGTGDWSGNLYDFYFRVQDRLTAGIKVPFTLQNGQDRIDSTKMHEALREALANALIHSDYYERRGVVVEKQKNKIVISNPGALRISKDEAMGGGISDPRNSALFLMFSLVGIGERAGSGLMNIEAVWKEENLPEPTLAEQFNPDRTIFTLPVHVVVERKDDSVNVDEIVSVNENVHVNTGKNVHVNENVQENVSVKLTKTEKRLLEIIQKNGKLTSIKLSESAGKDLRTITRGLRKLRENNLIERIGSDKTGVWKVIKSQ
jgi:predicted HTH transcriptional regulator